MTPGVLIAGVYSEQRSEQPDTLDEYLVLIHTGTQPMDMRGWSLTNRKQDRLHHYRYLFPRFLSNGDPWLLEPGGLILLYTGRGTSGCTATAGEARQYHLYQHRPHRIWLDRGDTACLYDRKGHLVDSLALPAVRRLA